MASARKEMIMADKQENLPDIVGILLAPIARANGGTSRSIGIGSVGADGVRPNETVGADGVRPTRTSKQQTPQRDKQFRGGKNK
jgi:hypothetical protein